MTKMNLSAPLPFVGQKRMFAKEFIKVLDQFPDKTIGNPFEGCTKREFNAHMNYSSGYTDIMLFKKQDSYIDKMAA